MTTRKVYHSAERHVWIAWACVAALSAWALLSMAATIERGLLPVVERFDVLSIQHQTDGSVLIAGTLIKARDCQITGLQATNEHDSRVRVDYMDRPSNADLHSRPVGPSSWGPWRVHPNGARYVMLASEHRCHPLWTIKTTLAAFQVQPRYQ